MINLNLFWVKYCDNENNFVSGSDTNKPPYFEGWFIVMKIVLCIEGVILLRVGRGRGCVHL